MKDPQNLTDAVVIASVSGGKDSAAMCLYFKERGIPYRAVFADTGWEAKETYAYLRGPLTDAIGPIEEVGYPGGMEALVGKKGMFPSRTIRFCTEELKVKPLHAFIQRVHDETGHPVISAIGLRADESAARAHLAPIDGITLKSKLEVTIWRPIIDKPESWVIEMHQKHNLMPNPLYLAGASRVGCWPCIHSRKSEIRFMAEHDPTQIDRLERLEASASEAAIARGARAVGFFQSRLAEDGGKFPIWPIRQVVDWSRTARGGRQYELFDSRDPDEGCTRWGMCEQPKAEDE
jgi:3'-phosphoadenosine 5'-phosphosulfate sulfotransferase (PAPS reductase)/FAD synthetase